MDILTSKENYIHTVTLNRPPYNFLDEGFVRQLVAALQAASEDADCRAIVLTHSGKCFSAGADFGALEGAIDIALVRRFYNTTLGLFTISKPIVAAVEGPAIGAGLGLTLVADFRVASGSARFSANFVRLGIHPGFGVDYLLPPVVGQQAARKLLYTGARIDGAEAHRIGLVDHLVEDGDALAQATGLAREIAVGAPMAVQDLHFTLRRHLYADVCRALDRSLASQTISFGSKDFREGVKAAAERRPPDFSGE
jgi:enoyl-CoA hydratase/carnithine racemase